MRAAFTARRIPHGFNRLTIRQGWVGGGYHSKENLSPPRRPALASVQRKSRFKEDRRVHLRGEERHRERCCQISDTLHRSNSNESLSLSVSVSVCLCAWAFAHVTSPWPSRQVFYRRRCASCRACLSSKPQRRTGSGALTAHPLPPHGLRRRRQLRLLCHLP